MLFGAVGKQLCEFGGGKRPREVVALAEATAERAERGDLRGVLDPFGDRLHPEVVRELEDRFRERRLVRMAPELGDEGAVHLEDLDRIALEIAE